MALLFVTAKSGGGFFLFSFVFFFRLAEIKPNCGCVCHGPVQPAEGNLFSNPHQGEEHRRATGG